MQIEYQITEDDFESAAWLALRKGAIPGTFQFYYGLAFIALWIFLCLAPVLATPNIRSFVDSLLFASFGFAILSWRLLFTKFKFRREYRRSPLLHLRTSLEIDAMGPHFKTSESDSRSSWQTYSKYRESKSTFLLSPSGNKIFIPIPKRELSQAQITELRTLFETHLPHK
jgi:hypothetical protein